MDKGEVAMRIDTIKLIASYFMVSLAFILEFTYGPLDLVVPEKHKKYKDLIVALLCIFWPSMIIVYINTVRMMKKKGE